VRLAEDLGQPAALVGLRQHRHSKPAWNHLKVDIKVTKIMFDSLFGDATSERGTALVPTATRGLVPR